MLGSPVDGLGIESNSKSEYYSCSKLKTCYKLLFFLQENNHWDCYFLEVFLLLGYNAMSLGNRFPTFQRCTVPSS
jgi:hypothetical protein